MTSKDELKKEQLLKIFKDYFDEYGLELTTENGEKIPKDLKVHITGLKQGWSIDVFILTEDGIRIAYYRGEDPNFTVQSGMLDLYLRDVKLLSNKFVYSIEDLGNDIKKFHKLRED